MRTQRITALLVTAWGLLALLAVAAQSPAEAARQRHEAQEQTARSAHQPVLRIEEAHRAVWKIHKVKPRETFAEKGTYSWGTAFAIGPRDFITNLHVLLGLLEGTHALESLTLVQQGNPVELRVNNVFALSIAHDLVRIETKETVKEYFSFTGVDFLELDDRISVLGYLEDALIRMESRDGIIYEDVFSYGFATHYSDLDGLSGSPILSNTGKVIGMVYAAHENIVYGIRLKYLKSLISGEKGVSCSEFSNLERCFLAGARHVKEMADQGNLLAIYEMGSRKGIIHQIDPILGSDIHLLKMASDMDHPRAQFELSSIYMEEKQITKAFDLLKKSALKNHPLSVFNVGRFYYYGWGTEKSEIMGINWIKKSLDQGYFPAKEFLDTIH